MAKQLSFQATNGRHHYSHGGSLRQKRAGRGARALSTKDSIHLVLKANKSVIRGGFHLHRRFTLIHHLLQKYQAKFFIKIEQVSIQGDHIHLLIRTSRRSLYQSFFRVFAGQIAQRFEKEGLLSVAGVDRGAQISSKVPTSAFNDNKNLINRVTDTPASFGSEPGLWREKDIVRTVGSVRIWEQWGRDGMFRAEGAEKSEQASIQAQVKLMGLWKYRPFTRVVKGWRAFMELMHL
ncbi:MAG: transposase [Pseudobdellovibrionaceae bacterium]